MATIFYWTTKGTPSERPLYGTHPTGQIVHGGVPRGVAEMSVLGLPNEIVWPIPPGFNEGSYHTTVVDTTGVPTLVANPASRPSKQAVLREAIEAALATPTVLPVLKNVLTALKDTL